LEEKFDTKHICVFSLKIQLANAIPKLEHSICFSRKKHQFFSPKIGDNRCITLAPGLVAIKEWPMGLRPTNFRQLWAYIRNRYFFTC
jgi:hypothetical protein